MWARLKAQFEPRYLNAHELSICFAQVAYNTDCVHVFLKYTWKVRKKSHSKKKDCSYLLLHHHPQRLSPEKNTTECHFLLQLLKNTMQKMRPRPPQEQHKEPVTVTNRKFQTALHPPTSSSNDVGTIASRPSPPFSFADIVFVIRGSPASQAMFVKNSISSNSDKSLSPKARMAQ